MSSSPPPQAPRTRCARTTWASSARKAHPGLRVTNIDVFAARPAGHGAPVEWDEALPGHRRFYSCDPVDNRLEFLEPVAL